MRKVNISNAKKRDALVGFEAKPTRRKVFQVLKDGGDKNGVRVLETTPKTDFATLAAKYDDLTALGKAIIEEDVDVDFEYVGMFLKGLKKIYVDSNNKVAFNVKIIEVIKGPDGVEKERKNYVPTKSNISVEGLPLLWTGKLIPKKIAIKKFAFARHYQIHHVNGLTYDFLFEMAKELHDKKALMFMRAGVKGKDPLVVTSGGTSYNGFLEGRVLDERYMLILHLTNLELKEFM
jgi:hypothetical protein